MTGLRPIDHEDEAEAPSDPEENLSFADRWVLPYVYDQALWPILVVVIAHAIVFIAPLMLYSVRDRHLLAIGVLAWLLFLSVQVVRDELKRIGHFGTLGWLLVATWGFSVVTAYYGGRWDII